MKLDERLRALQQMPENQEVKDRLYTNIVSARKRRFHISKEWALFAAIVAIAIFLILTPNARHMTASDTSIKAVYTYVGSEKEAFKARATRLYTGIQLYQQEQVLTFFAQAEQLPAAEAQSLGNQIVDIIVEYEHEQVRYKLGDTLLYNVDTQQYYSVEQSEHTLIVQLLHEPKPFTFTLLIPVSIIAINVWAAAVYKRKAIAPIEKLPNVMRYLLIALTIFGVLFLYTMFIGPLWKPLCYSLIIVYGIAIWRLIVRATAHPTIRKVEAVKIVVMMLVLILFIAGQ